MVPVLAYSLEAAEWYLGELGDLDAGMWIDSWDLLKPPL